MHAYSYKYIFSCWYLPDPRPHLVLVVDGHQTAHNSMIAGTNY